MVIIETTDKLKDDSGGPQMWPTVQLGTGIGGMLKRRGKRLRAATGDI